MFQKTLLLSSFLLVTLTQGFCDERPTSSKGPVITKVYCPSCSEQPSPDLKIRPSLEVKVGYFFFADSTLRKIYKEGGVDVQLSSSFPLWRWLQGYASFEFFERRGRSLNEHQRTSIWEIPISVGLKPVFNICPKIQYYFALGPRYFYIHEHNDSSLVDRHISHNAIGGFINTGFNFFPMEHFLIDVFGEYSYGRVRVHPHKHHVYSERTQIGGFSFGVGLGYAF